MSATLSRVGKFVSGHVNRALNWLNRPRASENACEGLEMIPLNDFLMENYSSVSLEDLQASGERARARWRARARARPASPRAASAAWAWAWPPPPPLESLARAALQLLATPLRSPAVRRALAAEQRFLCRRVGARFRRVSWIGRASLFWGLLFTLVSSCGVILALSGDLGRMLGEHPGMWFVQFSTYLMAYSTAIHVTQVICAILLLTAVQMSEASPPRVRDPTEAEVAQWFWSLGFPAPPAADPGHAPSTPSGSPTPAPLPAPSPGRTPAVLQVHAQIEHNPDGQRPRAYTRSTSSTHSLSPEAVKCGGSRLADSYFGSSPDGQGTTKRKATTGSSPGRSTISQSLIEELCDEDTAERGTRPSNDKRAQKTVPLRTPWLWTSVVTLATYTITAVTFYCSGSVAIPTTLCVILVLSTPCILDVLAEVLEVSEKTSDDLERLFDTDPSPESRAETSELASARSLEDALRDGSSPEFDEKKCSLQFRDLSSE